MNNMKEILRGYIDIGGCIDNDARFSMGMGMRRFYALEFTVTAMVFTRVALAGFKKALGNLIPCMPGFNE